MKCYILTQENDGLPGVPVPITGGVIIVLTNASVVIVLFHKYTYISEVIYRECDLLSDNSKAIRYEAKAKARLSSLSAICSKSTPQRKP